MSDYISRDAALTALQKPELFNVSPRFLQILRDLPAADVEPVRHGHWTRKKDNEGFPYFEHEECGKKYRLIGDLQYCPHCGAKMDLEDENGT